MIKLRIFIDTSPRVLEEEVDEYLAKNPGVEVLHMTATESLVGDVYYSSVYLLLRFPEEI